ncbi:hypothetical protein [Candidatus Chloroploca asiatica]|uniref:hypothetical protein n=1 Tax=Candidatus Chloroploca asiatica TaxID=1506545 RepID=UPI001142C0BB|nr:hypothetical protein [Candidatus Chloroploca asiatica]
MQPQRRALQPRCWPLRGTPAPVTQGYHAGANAAARAAQRGVASHQDAVQGWAICGVFAPAASSSPSSVARAVRGVGGRVSGDHRVIPSPALMTVLAIACADGAPGSAARGCGRDDHSLPAEALRQGGGEVSLAHPPGYGRGGDRACGMDRARMGRALVVIPQPCAKTQESNGVDGY